MHNPAGDLAKKKNGKEGQIKRSCVNRKMYDPNIKLYVTKHPYSMFDSPR